MICDNCGKSNIRDLSHCQYCGAEMPGITGGGGFADILSMAEEVVPYEQEIQKETIRELDIQQLIRKSDNIGKLTQKGLLFDLIAIGLSFIVLLTSIFVGVTTSGRVRDYNRETSKQLEETKKELKEYRTQVDKLLEAMGVDEKDSDSKKDKDSDSDSDSKKDKDSDSKKDKDSDTDLLTDSDNANTMPQPSEQDSTAKDADQKAKNSVYSPDKDVDSTSNRS